MSNGDQYARYYYLVRADGRREGVNTIYVVDRENRKRFDDLVPDAELISRKQAVDQATTWGVGDGRTFWADKRSRHYAQPGYSSDDAQIEAAIESTLYAMDQAEFCRSVHGRRVRTYAASLGLVEEAYRTNGEVHVRISAIGRQAFGDEQITQLGWFKLGRPNRKSNREADLLERLGVEYFD